MNSTSFPALAVLLLTLQFYSCAKNDGAPNNNNNGNKASNAVSSYLVKQATTIIYDPTSGSSLDSSVNNYTYDNNNRLITLSGYLMASQEVSLDTNTYTYSTGLITMVSDLVTLSPSSTWQTQTFTYYLDPISGYADSSMESISLFGGPAAPVAHFQYTYTNGYLTQLKNYENLGGASTLVSTSTYVISGGNTVSVSTTSTYGNTSDNFTFSTSSNTVAYFSNNLAVTGKSNTDLIASSTLTNSSGSTTLNFSYTFDSQNRVSTMVAKALSGQVEQQISFLYY